jgi:L,D-transpeptidase catalytic domain
MVALVAAVCGLGANRRNSDAPQQTNGSIPPSAPASIETRPLASRTLTSGRVDGQISPSVTRAIEHVLQQASDHPRAAVLDFSAHSSTPRFHVVDRPSGQVLQSFCVSHGHGSEGKRDDGYAEVFSNEPGSNASSLGLYRTGETYRSQVYPGLSMRLDGLSPTNSNARSRFIVIHEARYMDPESWKGKKMGRPGRSEGCFVFSKADRDAVISHLKEGALIYASYEKAP